MNKKFVLYVGKFLIAVLVLLIAMSADLWIDSVVNLIISNWVIVAIVAVFVIFLMPYSTENKTEQPKNEDYGI